MVKPFLMGLALILVMAFVVACGSAEESETTDTASESAATTTEAATPTEEAMEETTSEAMEETAEAEDKEDTSTTATSESSEEDSSSATATTSETELEESQAMHVATEDLDPALVAAADEWAGGPGAFYIGDGDFNRLVGPAPDEGLGDAEDMVNLAGLERESYLFDSQYYKNLVEAANFTNPTEMTYSGDPIEIQFACINRTVAPCELWVSFFKKQVEARTNGKVLVPITSFPELGIAGPDSLEQVTNGTLSWAEITSGYVSGHMPEAELAIMYGVYPDHEVEFKVTQAIGPELDRLFEENTDGGKVLTHMWVSGGDQFFFCKDPITTLEEFEGKKTRSHGSALSDWINGFGADAQFVAFSEVYTALERGILDCGVTVAFAAHAQRWYEVTEFMVGPLSSQLLNTVIVNRDVWEGLPADIQAILEEEGARHELEAIRVTPAWNEVWIQRNIDAGLEYLEFSDALMDHMTNVVATNHVVPGFISRQDDDNRDNIIELFNEKIAPIVGLKVLPDGTTERVPITQ